MIVAKHVADFLTIARAVMAFLFVRVGLLPLDLALPLASWMLLFCWNTDLFDGLLARRSRRRFNTWIGDNDLLVDMLVSAGVFTFLLQTGFISLFQAAAYLIIWLAIFLLMGIPRPLGMLVQAPIYFCLIWVAVRDAPEHGWWLVVWLGSVLIITWPRFPNEVIPDFLQGMRNLISRLR